MAVTNPPAFLQNAGATHNADLTRFATSTGLSGARAAASLIPRGGVHPHLGAVGAVTQNGAPNMSVNVGAGVFMVPGSEGATQGVYTCIAQSTTNLVITAAHASLPRIDIIVARVYDSAYSGVTNTWALEVVTGTPAGSPAAPAAPANTIVLANVAVAALATQILTANITDVRPYSAYGIITCRNTTDYPNPATEGMVVYNMADDFLSVCTVSGTPGTWSSAKGAQFLQRVIFTASGSFTKATYPGLKKVRVAVQASGGGGGGAGAAASGQHSMGGGGGGGGYAESWLDASALAASVTVTIGAGGAGGVGANSGANGNTSSFGAHTVASGGNGGQSQPSTANPGGINGGTAGVGGTGDLLLQGSGGSPGISPTANLAAGGAGGGSQLGGGGAGKTSATVANGVGDPGGNYGGGGGGAFANTTTAAANGGNGAGGIIIVDLYV